MTSYIRSGVPMKESPVFSGLQDDEMEATSNIRTLSKGTGVKVKKVQFINGDKDRVLWLGYADGRCISIWRRDPSDDDLAFKEPIREKTKADPTDVCSLAADRHSVSFNDGSLSIYNTSGDILASMRSFERVHGDNCDIRTLCEFEGKILSGSSCGSIVIIDAVSGATEKLSSGNAGVRSLCALNGGSLLVSGHSAGQLLIWDLRDSSADPAVSIPSKQALDAVTAIAQHPAQANLISFGTDEGTVGFCDVRGKQQLIPSSYQMSPSPINQIRFHPTYGDHMMSCSADGNITHWDASGVNTGYGGVSRLSAWLSDEFHHDTRGVKLHHLRPPSFSAASSIDLTEQSVVAASDLCMIYYYDNVTFSVPRGKN